MGVELRNSYADEIFPQRDGVRQRVFEAGSNPRPDSNQTVWILYKNGALALASPNMVRSKFLVEWGCRTGQIDELTEIQRNVLKVRYPIEGDIIISFGLLPEVLGVKKARHTLYRSEQPGLEKLEIAFSRIKKIRAVIELEQELGMPLEEYFWAEVRSGKTKDAIAKRIKKPPTFVYEWTRRFSIPSLSRSEATRNSWKNPEIRKRQMKGITDAWRDESKRQKRISKIHSGRKRRRDVA